MQHFLMRLIGKSGNSKTGFERSIRLSMALLTNPFSLQRESNAVPKYG